MCVRNSKLVSTNLAAVLLQIGYPTIAWAPHSVANGSKNLLTIAAATVVDLKKAATIKEFSKEPSKFIAAAAATVPVTGAGAATEKEGRSQKEGMESEKDDGMGFDLFD